MIDLMMLLHTLLVLVSLPALANAVSRDFTPWRRVKDWLGLGLVREVFHTNPVIDYILYLVWYLINCPHCLSFWVVGIVLNPLLAPVAYYISMLITKIFYTIDLS